MMMDTTVDTDGTAFICPECSFNGTSLPELISHMNEAHSEETVSKSEARPSNLSSTGQPVKRSRRKPAFSHQIVSQAARQSSSLFNQQAPSNVEPGFTSLNPWKSYRSSSQLDRNELWNRIPSSDKNGTTFLSTNTDDSSLSIISDENTNITFNSKSLSNSVNVAKRNPNVLHSILSQQRPIAPKNESVTPTKVTSTPSPSFLPMTKSSPGTDSSFYSPTNHSMQPFRKNFQCQMCRLTYKNFHDCTAHIRKKHEISHAQAGRYVEKLDTDATLPPSATGNYKFRVKVKSLPPQLINSQCIVKRTSLTPTNPDNSYKIFQCKYCSFNSSWSKVISQHQKEIHPTYPPHILQKEYVHQDNEINNNNTEEGEEGEEEGISTLMIDPVRAFGEVIDTNEDEGEEMVMEHDIDDDEEEALWKYQQEVNDLSESDISTTANHVNYSFAKRFKKFRCPHCEHSAPTLTKLKLHVATHINIKPFMCSICGWRANLRWYIQCHAKKRHLNMSFEVLQLSHEEAEQTINAYMKERGIDTKLNGGQDSKRRFQCSLCQFRSNHPKFIEQHIATNHPNKANAKMIMHKKALEQPTNGHTMKSNEHDDKLYSKFMIKSPTKSDYQDEIKSQALYNRSSLIQADGTVILPDPGQIVYPNYSSHANFNPSRLFYCALCYRGYRWRYDVKRHHKTMHETQEDDAALGLSMSPKSVKRRNKEFNRNFRYLEYVPQLDGLISATMSSVTNHFSFKEENDFRGGKPFEGATDDDAEDEESQDDELKLNTTDARTVDITEDEAAALLMIEPHKSNQSSMLVSDHPEDSVIIFEDDRPSFDQSKDRSSIISAELSKTPARASSGFKPYRCPYCFYRTNWRTDSLRHIRARHKIEPTQDGYYELTPEEAENTYAEYERTYGFIVAKKVLGRFTEFRHMEWKDLQKSIWEKIKDKQGYEQIIYDRLRPDDYFESPKSVPVIPVVSAVVNKTMVVKAKRMFTCMECAFRSHKPLELEKHLCARFQQSHQKTPHGKFLVSLYQCTTCSYRTMYRNYARKHISLHRSNEKNISQFYYCSFCGYNHHQRNRITVHIARQHPGQNTLTTTISFQSNINADFTIKQMNLRRSFIERQLNHHQPPIKLRVFYCIDCPHISTSILEHDHHRSCHQMNSTNSYKCNHCSFASHSFLYTRQHNLLHSKTSRLPSLYIDTKNLIHLSVSTIFKETLGKNRRFQCPFCPTFSSSTSSIVLDHVKNTHTGNSSQLNDSLIIGSDMAKEILALGETVTNDQRMDLS